MSQRVQASFAKWLYLCKDRSKAQRDSSGVERKAHTNVLITLMPLDRNQLALRKLFARRQCSYFLLFQLLRSFASFSPQRRSALQDSDDGTTDGDKQKRAAQTQARQACRAQDLRW